MAMKSSPSARHNESSVHAEQKRGQSCGCVGACTCKCNNLHARECGHNKHDRRARACLHEFTHKFFSFSVFQTSLCLGEVRVCVFFWDVLDELSDFASC